MDSDTIIIRIENGAFAGFECANPTIRRAAIVTDGHTERVAACRLLVTENEIAEAVRVMRGCELMGACNGLDGAREVAQEAERRSAAASTELAERLHVPIADRIPDLAVLLADVDELMPLIDDAERRHSDALTALREFKVMSREAAAIAAAHDGHHHQPRITIEHREHAYV